MGILGKILRAMGITSRADATPEQISAAEALVREQHAKNVAARQALFGNADLIARAKVYFRTLDASHQVAFRNSNPALFEAMLNNDQDFKAYVQPLFSQSAYQTADGRDLDPTVVEPVFA